ncbi:MAG: ParB N-terminal domain-containing protein [Clostridiaceae bacterium]|nr:ParB N-terminal domain-containing protein [Clostridiaceae bacterium]
MARINWTLRTFRLDELTDYYKNPRSLSEKEFKQLKTSLDKFGMIDKPIVNADSAHTIIGGHQRKHVLEATGVKEIECWIPDRELSDKEVEELNIRLNKNTGQWDFDALANEFDLGELLDWGFSEQELGIHPDIDFDEFDGEGDGGGSRMMNGDKVRVVLGALMFDIPDPDHSIYKLTEEADEDDVRDKLLSLIAMGELP